MSRKSRQERLASKHLDRSALRQLGQDLRGDPTWYEFNTHEEFIELLERQHARGINEGIIPTQSGQWRLTWQWIPPSTGH